MAEKQYRGFVKGAQWAANPIWVQVGVNVGKFPMHRKFIVRTQQLIVDFNRRRIEIYQGDSGRRGHLLLEPSLGLHEALIEVLCEEYLAIEGGHPPLIVDHLLPINPL
jgi:hypothetical protein